MRATPLLSATLLFAAALLTSCAEGPGLTFIINQQGGDWTLPGGIRLEVPPGALSQPTEITARLVIDPEGDGYPGLPDWLGALPDVAIALEPHGLTFQEPALLTLPIRNPDSALAVVRAADPDDESWRPMLHVDRTEDSLLVRIEGFSAYASSQVSGDLCPLFSSSDWDAHRKQVILDDYHEDCAPLGHWVNGRIGINRDQYNNPTHPRRTHPDQWRAFTDRVGFLDDYPYPLWSDKGWGYSTGKDDPGWDTFFFGSPDYYAKVTCRYHSPQCQVYRSNGGERLDIGVSLVREVAQNPDGSWRNTAMRAEYRGGNRYYPWIGSKPSRVEWNSVPNGDAAWAACKALLSTRNPEISTSIQVNGFGSLEGQWIEIRERVTGRRVRYTGEQLRGGAVKGPLLPGRAQYQFEITGSTGTCRIEDGASGTAAYDHHPIVHITCNPEETLCDGVDNDRDGTIDEHWDRDGDGYTTCGRDGVVGTADDDCNDGSAAQNPGKKEQCGNDIDEDCDGSTTDNSDFDGDGVACYGPDNIPGNADDDCNDNDARFHPGAHDPPFGEDFDCAPGPDDDGDGALIGVDCDDNDYGRAPGRPESCEDGFDSDCDTTLSETADADDDGIVDACEPVAEAARDGGPALCPLSQVPTATLYRFFDAVEELQPNPQLDLSDRGFNPSTDHVDGLYARADLPTQASFGTYTYDATITASVHLGLTSYRGRFSVFLRCNDQPSSTAWATYEPVNFCSRHGIEQDYFYSSLTQAQEVACQTYVTVTFLSWAFGIGP